MSTKKSCITVVCGIPASGKTSLIHTITNVLIKKSNNGTVGAVNMKSQLGDLSDLDQNTISTLYDEQMHIISYDKLIESTMQGEMLYITGEWKEFRKNVLNASEKFISSMCGFQTTTPSLSEKAVILLNKLKHSNNTECKRDCSNIFLIEDNMYYHSMRYEWFQIARKYGMGYCQLFLHCPAEVALIRNQHRKSSIPNEVITIMSTKIELPDPSKYYWEQYSLILDTSKEIDGCEIKDVFQTIQKALDSPVSPLPNDDCLSKEEARSLCSKSFLHQTDQILRKLVGMQVANERGNFHNKDDFQTYCKQINVARHQILTELRNGAFILPTYLVKMVQEGKEEANLMLEKELIKHLDQIVKNKIS